MATARNDGRPVRRSTGQPWLDRKYSQQPADPKLAAWADAAFTGHLHGRQGPLAIGPFRSEDAAKRAKNALYDVVYKRWNRAHPDEEYSLSANVTDPADGRCYARGQCRCEQNGCTPTPGPAWYIHARLHSKHDGRAHQARKPREEWDYDPLVPRQRQRGAEAAPASPRAGAGPAPSRPGERFGKTKKLSGHGPDEPPTGPKMPGGGGSSKRKPEPAKDAKARADEDEPRSALTKLRRWAG